jgi:hypothetical protein
MKNQIAIRAAILLALSLMAGCKADPNEPVSGATALTESERTTYLQLGELGIGDGYRAIVDNNSISRTMAGPEDPILRARALKNGSYYTNFEYAQQLYEVAILKPADSPGRAVLLDEAKKRLAIGARNLGKLHFVMNRDKPNQELIKSYASDLNSYDRLYNDITKAQNEK